MARQARLPGLTRVVRPVTTLVDVHPRHLLVTTVLACPICAATFWDHHARLRALDARAGKETTA